MLKLDLTGRAAVVTGGSGELGRTICRTLAACGAKIAIHYLSARDKAEQVARGIREAGGAAEVFQADVTKEDEVLAMRDAITAAIGAPSIVVNNAVIQYDWKFVMDQPLGDFESQFRSSVLQAVIMAKAFVPAMVENGEGRVIGINTECAMLCSVAQGAYVSGKRGMDGIMRVLAKEIGQHNITVNQVAPGWTQSDKIRELDDDPQAEYALKLPLKRAGTDQEIANVVAFLASDLAGNITGAYIPVCGGNVMPAI